MNSSKFITGCLLSVALMGLSQVAICADTTHPKMEHPEMSDMKKKMAKIDEDMKELKEETKKEIKKLHDEMNKLTEEAKDKIKQHEKEHDKIHDKMKKDVKEQIEKSKN